MCTKQFFFGSLLFCCVASDIAVYVYVYVLLYTLYATNEYAFLDEAKQGCTTKQLYVVHLCFVFRYGQRAATNEYASGKLANVNGRADDY